MRILIINILLAIGLSAVIAGTLLISYHGYDDQLSFTCFVVHSINAVLLLFREVLR